MSLLALCIGVSNYTYVGKLKGTLNDVRAVSSKLRILGFRVTTKEDLGYNELTAAIDSFISQVSPGDTVFVFFS